MDTQTKAKLLKKLALKNQDKILVLSAPEGYVDIFTEYEGQVDQVAIDDDWSAIRYKHVDDIKTMKSTHSEQDGWK